MFSSNFLNKTLSIFIEPPSVDELKRRLQRRGTETKESLEARINKALMKFLSSIRSATRCVNRKNLETARKGGRG